MGSYNLYRGEYGCHNDRLLNRILKGDWAFDGAVVSDWGGVHDTDQAIRNGLDLEFGTWTDGLTMGATNAYDNYYMAKPYLRKIENGEVGTEELDDKVRRVLRLTFRTAMNQDKPFGALCSEEHYAAARRIGEEGIVLLRNEGGVLPFDLGGMKRILVVGENAVKMMTVGGGSSSLKVQRETSPLDGIRARVGGRAEVVWARGYVGDVGGEYNGVKSGQDLRDDRSAGALIAEAVEEARKADAVVFVGGLNKSDHQDCEGADRFSLGLPYGQDAVIEALAAVNPRLVVALVSGNAVSMPWVDEVPAIVQAWYLGSEAGNALAAVLFGDANPSGKLPFTFPVRIEDNGAHATDPVFPHDGKTCYKDGIFVGYRWTEKEGIEPLFPFGHGLSYTTFAYGPVEADRASTDERGTVNVSVEVTNTGDRAGAEVVQLYIADKESSLPRPVKELKGFEKVWLEAGQSKVVTFPVGVEALRYYDDTKGEWVAEKGAFEALVGTSSADIKGSAVFELK